MTSFIYLIEAENGRVKIGSSNDPAFRANSIAGASPIPVRLIAQWPGSKGDEFELHKRFSAFRVHREWFRPDGELSTFVYVNRGVGVDAIPLWDEVAISQSCPDAKRRKQSEAHKRNWADPEHRARRLEDLAWNRQRSRRSGARPSSLSIAAE